MKSVCYVKPGVAYVEMPEPQIVNADDVKIKIAYSSICGSDLHIMSGIFDDYLPAAYPLGHEASGVITELGPGATVKGLKVGDRVTYYYNHYCGQCYYCRNGQEQFCTNRTLNMTSMSQYLVVRESQVFKLPENVSLKMGCLVEPVSVALRSIDRSNIRPGSFVAVSGAGGMGLLHIQLAKMKGASRIVAMDPIPEKRALALQCGADYAFDPLTENVVEKALELTDGRGFDCVIEASGVRGTTKNCVDIAGCGATIIYFAVYGHFDLPIDHDTLFNKELTITAAYQSPYMFPRAIELIRKLNLDPFLSVVFPAEACEEAFAAHRKGLQGKILMEFQ